MTAIGPIAARPVSVRSDRKPTFRIAHYAHRVSPDFRVVTPERIRPEPLGHLGYSAAMAAQNQHYIPKFILRQFLADAAKERMYVYDKHEDRVFATSIKNIMAERRFNEFAYDNYIASFEPVACGAEDQALPAYREVLAERRLSDSPQQKGALAVFLAFQLLRTKAQRDQWQAMEEELVNVVEGAGGRVQDMKGWEDWEPSTEDGLKRDHLTSIQGFLGQFAQIIARKDFLLMEAAPGTSFCLGDSPVVRSNSRDFGPYGNLGLTVEGIEIYMPLSANLLLCAWCPSLLGEVGSNLESARHHCQTQALRQVAIGRLDAAGKKRTLDEFAMRTQSSQELLTRAAEGRPVSSTPDNMDYYNSLQTSCAYRHLISRDGDFELARRINRKHPHLRRGHRMKAA